MTIHGGDMHQEMPDDLSWRSYGPRPDEGQKSRRLRTPELVLVEGSIVKLHVDAVVTAANARLAGGGGVDGAVHRAAGPELMRACQALPSDREGIRCPAGQARVTPGFLLAPWVIHAVGPLWDPDRVSRCAAALSSAYDMAFFLAANKACRSLAVPSLSTGAYGYPSKEAAAVALDRALHYLCQDPAIEVLYFALLDEETFGAFANVADAKIGLPRASSLDTTDGDAS
jgi:O-acetyl-ADP-ribose deacetylase